MKNAIKIVEDRIIELTNSMKNTQPFSEEWNILYISRNELEHLLKEYKEI